MFSIDFAVFAPFPLKSGLVFLKSGLVFLKSGKSILVDPRSKIQDFLGVLAQESWICGSKISQEESLGILDLGSGSKKVFWRSWILDPNTTVLRFSSLNAQLRVGSPLFLYAHREDM
jgi:hypothetical protein